MYLVQVIASKERACAFELFAWQLRSYLNFVSVCCKFHVFHITLPADPRLKRLAWSVPESTLAACWWHTTRPRTLRTLHVRVLPSQLDRAAWLRTVAFLCMVHVFCHGDSAVHCLVVEKVVRLVECSGPWRDIGAEYITRCCCLCPLSGNVVQRRCHADHCVASVALQSFTLNAAGLAH